MGKLFTFQENETYDLRSGTHLVHTTPFCTDTIFNCLGTKL